MSVMSRYDRSKSLKSRPFVLSSSSSLLFFCFFAILSKQQTKHVMTVSVCKNVRGTCFFFVNFEIERFQMKMTRFQSLCLVIGLKSSCKFFIQRGAKPKPEAKTEPLQNFTPIVVIVAPESVV